MSLCPTFSLHSCSYMFFYLAVYNCIFSQNSFYIFSIMLQVKYVADSGFYTMFWSPWGHFFISIARCLYCYLTLLLCLWKHGQVNGAASCSIMGSGCWYKNEVSWLFEGCRTSCPGWHSMATESSLAGLWAKNIHLSPLAVGCPEHYSISECSASEQHQA